MERTLSTQETASALQREKQMLAANRIAFKEWAVVCAALADGRQALILRKGGIHEGARGFQVEHDEFWLFPTYEHQHVDSLVEGTHSLLDRVILEKPSNEVVPISQYATVEDVIEIHNPMVLPSLVGLHIWSDRTVDQRFHYRQPGLVVLAVRIYGLAQAIELPNSPHFAGCRSWVELPSELPTAELKPVLSDQEMARRLAAIQVAASPIRLA